MTEVDPMVEAARAKVREMVTGQPGALVNAFEEVALAALAAANAVSGAREKPSADDLAKAVELINGWASSYEGEFISRKEEQDEHDKELDFVLDVISRLAASTSGALDGWRPIDSAPKPSGGE
jgi:U3 small nucleolar ribonucleoprotein component